MSLILLKKAPKCPKCKIPLKTEGSYLCGKDCCKLREPDPAPFPVAAGPVEPHQKYRCIKCFDIFYEEEKSDA